jgi:hypothetical protein
MPTRQKKRYSAWAKKKNSSGPFVTSVIYADSLKEAQKWFEENNYLLDGRVSLSKVRK